MLGPGDVDAIAFECDANDTSHVVLETRRGTLRLAGGDLDRVRLRAEPGDGSGLKLQLALEQPGGQPQDVWLTFVVADMDRPSEALDLAERCGRILQRSHYRQTASANGLDIDLVSADATAATPFRHHAAERPISPKTEPADYRRRVPAAADADGDPPAHNPPIETWRPGNAVHIGQRGGIVFHAPASATDVVKKSLLGLLIGWFGVLPVLGLVALFVGAVALIFAAVIGASEQLSRVLEYDALYWGFALIAMVIGQVITWFDIPDDDTWVDLDWERRAITTRDARQTRLIPFSDVRTVATATQGKHSAVELTLRSGPDVVVVPRVAPAMAEAMAEQLARALDVPHERTGS